MKEVMEKKVQLYQHHKEKMKMNEFNIGDKVTIKNLVSVYEVTYITRDGYYYVIEHEDWGAKLVYNNNIELWKPPVFSYFHPHLGLHDWEIVSERIKGDVHIRSITNPENIYCNVPLALVKHYLGDKYVG
jgi:hypothetical protein